MKAPIDKVKNGMKAYIDTEIAPNFDGLNKIAICSTFAMAIYNLENILKKDKVKSFTDLLGIIDEKGNVEIEVLENSLCDYFPEKGFEIEVPSVKNVFKKSNEEPNTALTFKKEDIKTLFKYIKES